MRGRFAILAVLVVAAIAATLVIVIGDANETDSAEARKAPLPGTPSVAIVAPRNGARQLSHAVVVKVDVSNFRLAPAHFEGEPLLGEGHIRFGLNRVPDCVDPVKLERALASPIGKGRLVGRSFDFPEYSGPNGVLAEQIGSAGSYSPATRPEIYYHDLPPGFYRLVVNLAENNSAPTSFHAVTNFQILPRPGHGPKPCAKGKVSSAKAAAALN
jgi:hypothetical protein